MDWRAWLNGVGLHIPASPNLDAIIVAVVLVAGAYWIGWFVAGRAAPRLAAAVNRWTDRVEGVTTKLVCTLFRYGLISLILLIVGNRACVNRVPGLPRRPGRYRERNGKGSHQTF